jgi:SecD/SecF fusion protein
VLGTTAQLYFYDWEANALTPNGKTVASQLLAQNPQALTISQGAGEQNDGSMSLYDAVKLASKQPERINPTDPLAGYGYYLFGKGGSPACAAAAKFYGVIQAAINQHCLLGGPDTSANRSLALANLTSGLPPGVGLSQGQLLVVKPGTAVLQAVPSSFSHPPNPNSPTTQFYALKDNVALTGTEITNPEQSTDAGGNPVVEFGYTTLGAKTFTNLTVTIAKRGNDDSGAGTKLEQHFAVALDNLLITVPEIDYTQYPFGIPAGQRGEISAGLTTASARVLATELRLGTLPIGLRLISIKHLSGRD